MFGRCTRRSGNSSHRFFVLNKKTGLLKEATLDEWAQKTASQNIREPELETILRRWWTKKYSLPWTHECAQEATLEDLLVEYWEDYYEANPGEARKAFAENGEFYFESTGDPLLDKWEEEQRKGLIPDLEEGMSQEDKAKLKEEREKMRRARGAAEELFQPRDPKDDQMQRKFASQFASPGTKKEQDLLQRNARHSMLGAPPDPRADAEWQDMLMGLDN